MEPTQGTSPHGEPTGYYGNPRHAVFADPLRNSYFLLKSAERRNLLYVVVVAICVICTVLVATTWNYKTYVVRVDNATGRIETGGQLKATNYEPREVEIQHFLVEFINNVRSVPMDPVVLKQNWNKADHFLTKEASKKLATFVQKDNPALKMGHQTVTPQINSIQLYPGSSNIYQVRWIEKEYSMNGDLTNRATQYAGLFQIVINPPTSEENILINPLGIFIKDLTITAETQTVNKEVE